MFTGVKRHVPQMQPYRSFVVLMIETIRSLISKCQRLWMDHLIRIILQSDNDLKRTTVQGTVHETAWICLRRLLRLPQNYLRATNRCQAHLQCHLQSSTTLRAAAPFLAHPFCLLHPLYMMQISRSETRVRWISAAVAVTNTSNVAMEV